MIAEEPVPNIVTTYKVEDYWISWLRLSISVFGIALHNLTGILEITAKWSTTLTKITHGFRDNFATFVTRDGPIKCTKARPLIVPPAIYTSMLQHLISTTHLATLRAFRSRKVSPAF